MAYDFQKLGAVEQIAEVPEGATVLVEVGGSIKRAPGDGLGGGGFFFEVAAEELSQSDMTITKNYDPLWEAIVEGLHVTISLDAGGGNKIYILPSMVMIQQGTGLMIVTPEFPLICINGSYHAAE